MGKRVLPLSSEEIENYLNRIVQGVSIELGNQFSVRRKDPERHFQGDPQALVHASGAEISFSVDRRDNRLTVRSNYNSVQRSRVDDQFFSIKAGEQVEITLSREKSPEAVANEMKRRFLPTFCETITRLSVDVDRHDSFVKNQRSVLQRLAKAAGYELRKHDVDRFDTLQPIDVKVVAYEKTADVTLRLTVDEAESLLQWHFRLTKEKRSATTT